MSLDPTNPPFTFPTPPSIGGPGGVAVGNPTVAGNSGGGGGGTSDGSDGAEAGGPSNSPALSIENILLAEFNDASTTAYQAMEDRARMFDRYLLIVGGVFVAGIGALKQLDDVKLGSYKQPTAVAILFLAAVIGVGLFLSLVRLRQAWQDSAITMNVIKEYYIREYKQTLPTIDRAWHWRLKTIPRGERFGSVTTTMSMTIAALGTLCWAIDVFLVVQIVLYGNTGTFPQLQGNPLLYIPAGAVGFVSLVSHWLYFRRELGQQRDKAIKSALKVLNSEGDDVEAMLHDLMGYDGSPVVRNRKK